MKKPIAILVGSVMVFSFVSCGNISSSDIDNEETLEVVESENEESAVETEPSNTPTPKPTETSATLPAMDISASDYWTDYPITDAYSFISWDDAGAVYELDNPGYTIYIRSIREFDWDNTDESSTYSLDLIAPEDDMHLYYELDKFAPFSVQPTDTDPSDHLEMCLLDSGYPYVLNQSRDEERFRVVHYAETVSGYDVYILYDFSSGGYSNQFFIPIDNDYYLYYSFDCLYTLATNETGDYMVVDEGFGGGTVPIDFVVVEDGCEVNFVS